MLQKANLVCMNPNCGKTYSIKSAAIRCDECSFLLDVIYEEKPSQADTLNYLGFATRKLGDFKKGEEYYLLGLKIDPNHKGINEYLGELYVATNRHNLAVERLEVLKSCNCKEYDELKAIIAGEKVSKY